MVIYIFLENEMDWKLFLGIISYLLPCIGFVLFIISSSLGVHKLVKAFNDHGGKDYDNGTLWITGTPSHDIEQAKKARKDIIIESALVIGGATCGIIALLL